MRLYDLNVRNTKFQVILRSETVVNFFTRNLASLEKHEVGGWQAKLQKLVLGHFGRSDT